MASPADGEKDNQQKIERELNEDTPPVLSTWNRVYALVIGFLALLIFLFYLFTKAYQLPQ